jgi:predicted transcriptional regulator
MTSDLTSSVAAIVAAYLSKNAVPIDEIPALIKLVHESLVGMEGKGTPSKGEEPAVPIGQSVMPDYIVCLEDGKKMKMLKRYLKTTYDLTPAQYREKWGLPANYPMVAPNYARRRSKLAKEHGLGRGAKTK